MSEYENAKVWLKESVEAILAERSFNPKIDWFKCNYLCGRRDRCEFFKMSGR